MAAIRYLGSAIGFSTADDAPAMLVHARAIQFADDCLKAQRPVLQPAMDVPGASGPELILRDLAFQVEVWDGHCVTAWPSAFCACDGGVDQDEAAASGAEAAMPSAAGATSLPVDAAAIEQLAIDEDGNVVRRSSTQLLRDLLRARVGMTEQLLADILLSARDLADLHFIARDVAKVSGPPSDASPSPKSVARSDRHTEAEHPASPTSATSTPRKARRRKPPPGASREVGPTRGSSTSLSASGDGVARAARAARGARASALPDWEDGIAGVDRALIGMKADIAHREAGKGPIKRNIPRVDLEALHNASAGAPAPAARAVQRAWRAVACAHIRHSFCRLLRALSAEEFALARVSTALAVLRSTSGVDLPANLPRIPASRLQAAAIHPDHRVLDASGRELIAASARAHFGALVRFIVRLSTRIRDQLSGWISRLGEGGTLESVAGDGGLSQLTAHLVTSKWTVHADVVSSSPDAFAVLACISELVASFVCARTDLILAACRLVRRSACPTSLEAAFALLRRCLDAEMPRVRVVQDLARVALRATRLQCQLSVLERWQELAVATCFRFCCGPSWTAHLLVPTDHFLHLLDRVQAPADGRGVRCRTAVVAAEEVDIARMCLAARDLSIQHQVAGERMVPGEAAELLGSAASRVWLEMRDCSRICWWADGVTPGSVQLFAEGLGSQARGTGAALQRDEESGHPSQAPSVAARAGPGSQLHTFLAVCAAVDFDVACRAAIARLESELALVSESESTSLSGHLPHVVASLQEYRILTVHSVARLGETFAFLRDVRETSDALHALHTCFAAEKRVVLRESYKADMYVAMRKRILDLKTAVELARQWLVNFNRSQLEHVRDMRKVGTAFKAIRADALDASAALQMHLLFEDLAELRVRASIPSLRRTKGRINSLWHPRSPPPGQKAAEVLRTATLDVSAFPPLQSLPRTLELLNADPTMRNMFRLYAPLVNLLWLAACTDLLAALRTQECTFASVTVALNSLQQLWNETDPLVFGKYVASASRVATALLDLVSDLGWRSLRTHLRRQPMRSLEHCLRSVASLSFNSAARFSATLRMLYTGDDAIAALAVRSFAGFSSIVFSLCSASTEADRERVRGVEASFGIAQRLCRLREFVLVALRVQETFGRVGGRDGPRRVPDPAELRPTFGDGFDWCALRHSAPPPSAATCDSSLAQLLQPWLAARRLTVAKPLFLRASALSPDDVIRDSTRLEHSLASLARQQWVLAHARHWEARAAVDKVTTHLSGHRASEGSSRLMAQLRDRLKQSVLAAAASASADEEQVLIRKDELVALFDSAVSSFAVEVIGALEKKHEREMAATHALAVRNERLLQSLRAVQGLVKSLQDVARREVTMPPVQNLSDLFDALAYVEAERQRARVLQMEVRDAYERGRMDAIREKASEILTLQTEALKSNSKLAKFQSHFKQQVATQLDTIQRKRKELMDPSFLASLRAAAARRERELPQVQAVSNRDRTHYLADVLEPELTSDPELDLASLREHVEELTVKLLAARKKETELVGDLDERRFAYTDARVQMMELITRQEQKMVSRAAEFETSMSAMRHKWALASIEHERNVALSDELSTARLELQEKSTTLLSVKEAKSGLEREQERLEARLVEIKDRYDLSTRLEAAARDKVSSLADYIQQVDPGADGALAPPSRQRRPPSAPRPPVPPAALRGHYRATPLHARRKVLATAAAGGTGAAGGMGGGGT